MENNVKFIADDGTVASLELAKQFQDIIEYVGKTPLKKMFPNKYRASIQHLVEVKTDELFQKYPTMPLKKVVSIVLEKLDDDTISAELILEMTQLIIQNWVHKTDAIYVNQPSEAMA